MTMYFDTHTGQLLDDLETDVEPRLAQRHGIVPVDGRALEVVEAGNKSVDDFEPPEDMTRPEAEESKADAEKAHKEAEKANKQAHEENVALAGTAAAEDQPEELPADGEPGENTEEVEKQQEADNKAREKAAAEARKAEEKPDDKRQERRAAAKKEKAKA